MSVSESKKGTRLQLKIFNTRTAGLLRVWEGPEEEVVHKRDAWPILKWSAQCLEDTYCARMAPSQTSGAIQVFRLPEMTLLDGKSIKLEGLESFQWR